MMGAILMPGALAEYAWAVPEMLHRTAALGAKPRGSTSREHHPEPASWTPEVLVRAGAFAFRTLQAEFDEASAVRPDQLVTFHRRVAGLSVGFRVVGQAVARQLMRSLGHLSADPPPTGTPDLTIDVWDEQASGVASAVRPSGNDLSPYGTILYSPDSRFISYQRPEAESWLDRRRRHVVAWYRSADRVYLDQLAKPFNKLLFDPLRDRGVAMAHAGLVARNGVAALMPGKSGSGKSTCSLTCLASGFDFLGDDYVGLEELGDGSFRGHSLFASSVLDPNHLTRFPAFQPDAEQTAHDHEIKSFLPLLKRHRHQLKVSSPIGLILIPRIVDTEITTYRRASRFAALMALVPPSLLSMPRPRLETFDMFVRLAQRTPACWLELGRDIDSIPRAVDQALARESLR